MHFYFLILCWGLWSIYALRDVLLDWQEQREKAREELEAESAENETEKNETEKAA